jgi:hypothetical protein
MTTEERRRRRFTEDFRKARVNLMELGKITVSEVSKLYEVKPDNVQRWPKKWLALLFMAIALLTSCSMLHFTPSKKIEPLEFSNEAASEKYTFIYQNAENSPDLITLKSTYRLDSVVQLGSSELMQAAHLLKWTQSRWIHDATNQPSKNNTLTILKEAESGQRFRCVEYGFVLRSVLASCQFNARTLGLKTKDVEVTRFGAGHVLTEVWSSEFNKWFMLDPQFNIIPVLDQVPLNAVEFQNAIVNGKDFKLIDAEGEISSKRRKDYMNFIPHYLYYFDFKFDQRELDYDSSFKVNDKGFLMLLPVGAKQPSTFQRKFKLDYFEYTNSLNEFYRKP